MKTPRIFSLSFAALFAHPALAHAHPGHDGDHDFVWEFGHLAEHPLATLACVFLLVAAGWSVWRLSKSSRQATKTEHTRRE